MQAQVQEDRIFSAQPISAASAITASASAAKQLCRASMIEVEYMPMPI